MAGRGLRRHGRVDGGGTGGGQLSVTRQSRGVIERGAGPSPPFALRLHSYAPQVANLPLDRFAKLTRDRVEVGKGGLARPTLLPQHERPDTCTRLAQQGKPDLPPVRRGRTV